MLSRSSSTTYSQLTVYFFSSFAIEHHSQLRSDKDPLKLKIKHSVAVLGGVGKGHSLHLNSIIASVNNLVFLFSIHV